MCIGIPMQVLAVEPGFAHVTGRGEARRVSTLLVGDCAAGQWLLVFLNDAREVIDAERAQEVNATLDLLQAVIATGSLPDDDSAGFVLPSAMDVGALQRLTGA
jgi:hydrogenase expression/formation protein HypC